MKEWSNESLFIVPDKYKIRNNKVNTDDIKNKYRKLSIKYKGELYNYAAKKFKEHGIDSKFVKFIEGE